MTDVKICTRCKVEKDTSEFHKSKDKKFGVNNVCKICAKIISKKYYSKNSKQIKQRVSCYSQSYIPKHSREIDSRLKNLCTKAKSRTKEFTLIDQDLLDLWEKQNGQCAYTKLPMLATSNQFNTVSLDRVDSSKGYVVGNVQLVCAAINKMKQEYTEELFVLMSHLVTQNNKLSETPEVLLARYFPLGTLEK